MLKEQIKKDFGLDLPISGGSANSLNDAMLIETNDRLKASWTEMHILRIVLGVRGWHWRCIDKEQLTSESGQKIEKVVCETKRINGDEIHSDKRNFYFNVDSLNLEKSEIIGLPGVTLRGMGFGLPYQIGWLHYDNLIDNESEFPGMGLTVAYSMPNTKASIYVYDKGEKLVDSVGNPNLFRKEFESAVGDFMVINPEMGAPTYHEYPGILMSVFVEGRNYSMISLGTFKNKYVKLRLTSDDSLERFKFDCIRDSISSFFSLFK